MLAVVVIFVVFLAIIVTFVSFNWVGREDTGREEIPELWKKTEKKK